MNDPLSAPSPGDIVTFHAAGQLATGTVIETVVSEIHDIDIHLVEDDTSSYLLYADEVLMEHRVAA